MNPPPTIPDFVPRELEQLGVTLAPDRLDTLARYLARLLDATQRVNLTAIREPDAAWRRLIIDSLTLLPGFDPVPAGAAIIDIGTGGGLPGIPLAIARPDLRVTLLEATGKKVRFLNDCITELHLANTQAIQARAEAVGQDAAHRQRYDVAVSRAVGPMPEVLEYSLPLVKVGGRVLVMKGPKVEQELAAAGDALNILGAGELEVFEAYPPAFGQDLVIVSLLKDRATPKAYPRRPGVPHHEPL
ncbi:MAG: 16S rRNA (guanine(527)-N(7))-methyltransferase RsmG [Phycisphaeraceae bacterium]